MTASETARCRALKRGVVDLTCELADGHDEGPDGTWHRAILTDRREVAYQSSHHVIEMTETVTWEPIDHVKESVRMLMKDKR